MGYERVDGVSVDNNGKPFPLDSNGRQIRPNSDIIDPLKKIDVSKPPELPIGLSANAKARVTNIFGANFATKTDNLAQFVIKNKKLIGTALEGVMSIGDVYTIIASTKDLVSAVTALFDDTQRIDMVHAVKDIVVLAVDIAVSILGLISLFVPVLAGPAFVIGVVVMIVLLIVELIFAFIPKKVERSCYFIDPSIQSYCVSCSPCSINFEQPEELVEGYGSPLWFSYMQNGYSNINMGSFGRRLLITDLETLEDLIAGPTYVTFSSSTDAKLIQGGGIKRVSEFGICPTNDCENQDVDLPDDHICQALNKVNDYAKLQNVNWWHPVCEIPDTITVFNKLEYHGMTLCAPEELSKNLICYSPDYLQNLWFCQNFVDKWMKKHGFDSYGETVTCKILRQEGWGVNLDRGDPIWDQKKGGDFYVVRTTSNNCYKQRLKRRGDPCYYDTECEGNMKCGKASKKDNVNFEWQCSQTVANKIVTRQNEGESCFEDNQCNTGICDQTWTNYGYVHKCKIDSSKPIYWPRPCGGPFDKDSCYNRFGCVPLEYAYSTSNTYPAYSPKQKICMWNFFSINCDTCIQ